MKISTQKGFTGLDERTDFSDGIATSRIRNFIIEPSGALKKRAEIKRLINYTSSPTPGAPSTENPHAVYGIWAGMFSGEETVAVSIGGMLYITKPKTNESHIYSFTRGECLIFEFGGELYLKTDSRYAKYNGSEIVDVEPYIPCVAIGCSADGSGEPFEQINLLSDYRRQIFSSDGVSNRYRLSEDGVVSISSVKLDGEEYGGTFSLADGNTTVFSTPPSEGIGNLEITYRMPSNGSDRSRILGCRYAMSFGGNSDGRLFLWGNPEYPNYRFHSELADGIPSVSYFPVNAFTQIGNSRINCIVQQYDRQLIFTKNQAFYSKCELREDELGNIYSSFPVYSLNGGKGCLVESSGCVINNRPVTLCEDGLNIWESTSVENEKNAVCISQPIQKSMHSMLYSDLSDIHFIDFQSERELYLIHGDTAYVFDYGEGRWYTLGGFGGDSFAVCGDAMYICRDGDLYCYRPQGINGDTEAIFESTRIIPKRDGETALARFDADIYTSGSVSVTVEFIPSCGEASSRTYSFGANAEGYRHISCRPSLKRTRDFKIRLSASGGGSAVIHSMTVTTRENERRKRNGIL